MRPLFPVIAWSFSWFFAVLSGYYVVRPVRETMGSMLGTAKLQQLFLATFLVMLVANPLYSWLVGRVSRRLLVHLVYRLFALCLLGFWWTMYRNDGQMSDIVAQMFFVWVSVFNLFAVSMFWSFSADVFNNQQARRWYGVIAAGGTLGGICGSFVAGLLVERIGIAQLLLIPMILLELATHLMDQLHRASKNLLADEAVEGVDLDEADQPTGGGVWSGLLAVFRSPYLIGICIVLLLSQLCGTTAYFQQAEIVLAELPSQAQQLKFYSNINLAGQIVTVGLQAVVAGMVMHYFGLSVALCVLPVVYLASFIGLGMSTTLGMLALTRVAQRGAGLGIMVPAQQALFTVVPREQKYKAKAFIDTAVFRGGDVMAGWIFVQIREFGWDLAKISFAMIPIVVVWSVLAWWLGRAAKRRTA